jgi:FAD:protein FMN transferase
MADVLAMRQTALEMVALARHAMATRFEVVLYGEDPVALRAAGEEALNEVERLEAQLSLYKPTSEIAHLNRRAGKESVRVEPGLFRLIQHAKQLWELTGGAFDITIAPLMRCWGLMGGEGKVPTREELESARAIVGMQHVQLDPAEFTVRFDVPGLALDLGAIGKGYAVEQAADILRQAGINSALFHGGTSTVYALGALPNGNAWKVAIQHPDQELATVRLDKEKPTSTLAVVELKDEALSVSAVWGKFFRVGKRIYSHIMDPRTGQPVSHAALSAIILPSATETDALSTALLVAGISGHKGISGLRPGMRSLVVEPGKGKGAYELSAEGIEVKRTQPARNKRRALLAK